MAGSDAAPCCARRLQHTLDEVARLARRHWTQFNLSLMAAGTIAFAAAFAWQAAVALACLLDCPKQQGPAEQPAKQRQRAVLHCDCTGQAGTALPPPAGAAATPPARSSTRDLAAAAVAVACTAVHALGLFSDSFIVAEGLAACVLAAVLVLALAWCQTMATPSTATVGPCAAACAGASVSPCSASATTAHVGAQSCTHVCSCLPVWCLLTAVRQRWTAVSHRKQRQSAIDLQGKPGRRKAMLQAALLLACIPAMACLGLVPRTSVQAMQQAASAAAATLSPERLASRQHSCLQLLRGALPCVAVPCLLHRLQRLLTVRPTRQAAPSSTLLSAAVREAAARLAGCSYAAAAAACCADPICQAAAWLRCQPGLWSTQALRSSSSTALQQASAWLCFGWAAAAAALGLLAALVRQSTHREQQLSTDSRQPCGDTAALRCVQCPSYHCWAAPVCEQAPRTV